MLSQVRATSPVALDVGRGAKRVAVAPLLISSSQDSQVAHPTNSPEEESCSSKVIASSAKIHSKKKENQELSTGFLCIACRYIFHNQKLQFIDGILP